MQIEEVDSGEVLTGVRLFQHLLKTNESQTKGARDKIHEYTKLQETLNSITNQSRRQVLAPVAEGLAYFDAELVSTNNILVLLGENWFVERSAVQAAAIAERRLDFLRREVRVLEEENKSLQQRQVMFTAEIPEANVALRKLMKETEEGLSEALMASHGPCRNAKVPNSSVDNAAKAEPAAPNLVDQAVADNPQLAVFDEQDELTEGELAELERELADVLDNDEVVERALTARMIAKKERRIQAEMSRTASSTGVPPLRTDEALESLQNTKQSLQYNQSEFRASPESKDAPSRCVFSSPADIGNQECSLGPGVNPTGAVSSSSIEKASTLPEESIIKKNLSPRTKKRVSFADEHTGHKSDASGSLSLSTSASTQENNSTGDGVMSNQLRTGKEFVRDIPVPERKTLAIGDIVEHDLDALSNSMPALDTSLQTGSSRKRNSLFKRYLEGENDGAM